MGKRKEISNWGRYPRIEKKESLFDNIPVLDGFLSDADTLIARGMGRCYGDSSLGENIINTASFNRFLAFDDKEGVIECESGVTLDEILQVVVPKGWFIPVTPGTKFVTVGGAIASDIHGKNHHIDGSFSRHVLSLQIKCSDGTTYHCTPTDHADLFSATCGGMGLTGIILSAKIRLKKIATAYIRQKQLKAPSLDKLLELFNTYQDYTYSVAWVDCLSKGKSFGRGILMLGEHAEEQEVKPGLDTLKVHKTPKFNIPFNFPSLVLNKLTIRLFNTLYYLKNLREEQDSVVHYDGFFYPLDNINNWNRMYGKRGFFQYQFVLPLDKLDLLKEVMLLIAKNNKASFLSVLKVFGEQDGLLSFPMKGYTLALDIPYDPHLDQFLDQLDLMISEGGGRFYLAKDARMKKETFWQTYQQADKFMEIVNKYNPGSSFSSLQSQRLGITS